MESYGFFVGIDVSKEWIDVSCRNNGGTEYLGRFANDDAGFGNMLRELEPLTGKEKDAWLFCFENTGSYSKPLAKRLFLDGYPYLEESPLTLSRHLSLKRGKDDKSDSIAICDYAYRYREELTPSVPEDANCARIKHLLARRALLVKQKTALINTRKVKCDALTGEEGASLKKMNEGLLKLYREGIRETDRMIAGIIKEDETLKENERLIRTVKGVGPVTAAYMIAFTGNFKRFGMNTRKFACYCGIAPFPNRSGKYKGKDRVSKRGNQTIKAILSNAVVSAVSHDAQLRMYYERMKGRGKPAGSIYNAIKNKLVARIFAVVKRQTEFVDVFAYK